MKIKIIVVVGPTAVGKSALGIELAQHFNGEIVSGDSQQIYQELSIGTAKVSVEEQAMAVHHLIDMRSVSEGYSAFDFVQEAKLAIQEIVAKKKLPILVGGTGLYIQSLLEGYHLGGNLDQEALLVYRKQLEESSDQDLFAKVQEKGLEIPQLNRRRAIRALELAAFGQEMQNQDQEYEPFFIGLTDQRELLYERINQRVDLMMDLGLLEEVSWLYTHHPDSQASKGIGYKEFFPYFKGEMNLKEAVEKVKQQTRRFAKRQLTWFRNRMAVPFYVLREEGTKEQIFREVEAFLNDSD